MNSFATPKPVILYILCGLILTACSVADPADSDPTATAPPTASIAEAVCPVTEPAWVKPPEDEAIPDPPVFGYYFANQDQSILASAGWIEMDEVYLRAGKEGIKIGWFRPAGATLEISGERLDAPAPPLAAHVPCCYPTHFQSSGLVFPTEGCWQITAKAADSELTFVVEVEP